MEYLLWVGSALMADEGVNTQDHRFFFSVEQGNPPRIIRLMKLKNGTIPHQLSRRVPVTH